MNLSFLSFYFSAFYVIYDSLLLYEYVFILGDCDVWPLSLFNCVEFVSTLNVFRGESCIFEGFVFMFVFVFVFVFEFVFVFGFEFELLKFELDVVVAVDIAAVVFGFGLWVIV